MGRIQRKGEVWLYRRGDRRSFQVWRRLVELVGRAQFVEQEEWGRRGGESFVRINKYKSVVLPLHEAPHNAAIRNWILLPLSSNPFIFILAYFISSTFHPRGSPLKSIPHLALGWTMSAAITLFDTLAWTITLNPDESSRSVVLAISLHSWLPNDLWCPQPNLASSLQQATFTASSSPSPSAYPNLHHTDSFLLTRYACISLPWNLHSCCSLCLDQNALTTHSPLPEEISSTIEDQSLVKTCIIPRIGFNPKLDNSPPFPWFSANIPLISWLL